MEIYRHEWLSARRDYPEEGRTFLKEKFQRISSWLIRHDKEWFLQNLPPLKKVGTFIPASQIDWKSRDSQLAEAVKLSALCLKVVSGRPVRITKTLIANNLDNINLKLWLFYNKKMLIFRLPLTANALDEVVETLEDFAIRRIHWKANQLREEGIYVTKLQFLRKVGIQNSSFQLLPKIQIAIESAMELFEPFRAFKSEQTLGDEESISTNLK
nr:TnsD family Tn7-like transposition protein [Nostoc sp. ChiSLP03a]MDZ8213013.1 TnsD family Tn7-like transposition protein [Nostoc sp. ChiSLP03a]